MQRTRQFASDNYSGICPEAWAAMAQANVGHQSSYGQDPWTQRAADLLRQFFETDCQVFFVFNGTAANALALASLCQPYQSVLCHQLAHIEASECGAPEFFTQGSKLRPLPGADGKLDPAAITPALAQRGNLHFPPAQALSLTQATELGTLYTVGQLQALTDQAHRGGLQVHVDGARFANALAALHVTPAELTWRAGVDVLCFGGSKNGLALGEAVVFFNPALARDFAYRCKQGGQLASKMRFLAAPWVGVLQDGALLRHAAHANTMAQRLATGLRPLPGVELGYPVQANAVFARIPAAAEAQMHELGWQFYTGVITPQESRLMCSWDTMPAEVDAFVADLRSLLPK